MEQTTKGGKIVLTGANPMEFFAEESPTGPMVEATDEMRRVGATIKEYIKAAQQLLAGRYSHLREVAPPHLVNPGNFVVAFCSDGLVVRFEAQAEQRKMFLAKTSKDLAQCAFFLSQRLIRIQSQNGMPLSSEEHGITINLSTTNPATNVSSTVASFNICFDVRCEPPEHSPQPPQKPLRLFSVRNTFELGLEGELLSESSTATEEGQKFLTRSRFRLPVGWDCIEAYPLAQLDQWKPEYAPLWAENDLLAAVVAHQFHESQYQSLDPNAEARRQYAQLLRSFKELLDSDPEREQILHSFLQNHPELLCPTHVKMWSKLPFGSTITDFVFRDATNDYLLVELERSTLPLFRRDGHASADLTHAQGQITDWKRYIEDNLPTVQRELGLSAITSNPRGLVVIGRSNALTPENRRKLQAMQNELPKLSILTYDDVYENAKAVIENLLGPVWEVESNTQIYYFR
jgi:hypothetical protein